MTALKTRTTRAISIGLSVAAAATLTVMVGACGEDRRSGFGDGLEDAGTTPGLINPDGALPDGSEGDAGVCLSETLGAEPVPLAMLIVMDQSTSMNSPTATPKWDAARQAMIAFADTPGAAGAKLGLTFFPLEDSAADECMVSAYQPVIPLALLPGNGVPLKDALVARPKAKGSNTPMGVGLQGGVEIMKKHLADNVNEEGVIILVTDGSPGGCSDTIAKVATVAQTAQNGTPRIRTFVVGMEGANFTNLDTVAAAGGGAPKAFNASGGTSDAGVSPQQQLIDALEQIRSGALGCEYVVPTPDASKGTVDPSSVEIEFTAGTNDEPQKFKRVDSEAQCGATTGGFYYDDPKNPKRIILCPASCEDVRGGTAEAKLDVVLGCIKQVN